MVISCSGQLQFLVNYEKKLFTSLGEDIGNKDCKNHRNRVWHEEVDYICFPVCEFLVVEI